MYDLVFTGRDLSPEEADAVEQALITSPDDIELRTQMLGFYYLRARNNPDFTNARIRHILWFIASAPEATIAGRPHAAMHRCLDVAPYDQALDLWLEQTRKQPKNPKILWNAAHFAFDSDKSLAYDLLEKGRSLEPGNVQWLWQRAFWMSLGLPYLPSEQAREQAVILLALYEQVLQSKTQTSMRPLFLSQAALVAYQAEAFDKASLYTHQLLESAQGDEDADDALHQGSIMLGRLALHDNDREAAKSYLLAAGDVTGSPALESFGPNMLLAQELLQKGEQATVLAYFDRCARFWKEETLAGWRTEIQRGELPDFGGNLRY